MKKVKFEDERIVVERRKINSEAFGILMIVLLVSSLVQQFWLDAPIEQYVVEMICFLGISIYILIRNMMFGHDLFGEGKLAKYIPLVNSVVTGLVITTINGVCNYIQHKEIYQENGISLFIAILIITFISVAISTFIVISCLDWLNRKRQAKIMSELDKEECE